MLFRSKVRELSGLDVYGDADDQTTALLALRILQLEGLRPWGSIAPGATPPAVRTS